jgi:hypothetical protein
VNVTGYGQYSKQTSGIRDPNKIMNQQQKLIFIYPMLFADKIRVPNVQSFETLMRDFISVTFLSDLFVQNTFNVIGLANQIRPLWDEHREVVDPSVGILKALSGSQHGVYTSGPSTPNYPVGPEHFNTLQNKINQKTAVIQQLVKSDPKMAKTRPFIEVITLGNMIEVPVIVGTSPYPVDTLTLMYVLIAAIGLNKKLTNETDLNEIFHELETMNETKYWNLLNNLTKSPKEIQDLADRFRGKVLSGISVRGHTVVPGLKNISGWGSTPIIANAARGLATRVQNRIDNPKELEQQRQIFAPLLLKQDKLDQTKLYFKFVLDPDFAKRRFGIDASKEDAKLNDISQVKLQGELSKIQNVTMSAFAKMIGTLGTSLLLSITNLVSTPDSTVNVMLEKSRNIDNDMMSEIEPQLTEILIGIDNGLKGNSSQASRNKIDILKDLCKIDSSETLKEFTDNIDRTSIISNDFNFDQFKNFITYITNFSNVSISLSNKIENEIKFITSDQSTIITRFDTLKKLISNTITGFFKPFKEDLNNTPTSQLAQVAGTNNTNIINRTIPTFISGLTQIFYFVFLMYLQASLCKFILTADVDVETAANEVTTWPNYTLVLPVEIVLALHAAVMGASWEHMLKGGQQGQDLVTKRFTTKDDLTNTKITTEKNKPLTKEQVSTRGIHDINEGYIKGIVKFICQRLDVPNLFVVDSKKGDIYYKLMNQTDVNKTKITTIETFIHSKLNRQMVSQF